MEDFPVCDNLQKCHAKVLRNVFYSVVVSGVAAYIYLHCDWLPVWNYFRTLW